MAILVRPGTTTISHRFLCLGLAGLAASLAFLLVMVLRPIDAEPATAEGLDQPTAPVARPAPRDLGPLLAKMAGARLIRPAQVQAAVMDSGAAKQILKKLKLQGIVQLSGEPVAYIQVEGGGTVSARKGGTVLDLIVERIDTGKVTLSLQGVMVELVY